ADQPLGGDGEDLPVLEMDDAVDVADAELRPLDVAHDRDVLAEIGGDAADDLDDAAFFVRGAVREIEAEDVDARGEETVDGLLRAAGGAEGGDDFRASQRSG